MDIEKIYAIERPHKRLMTLYLMRSFVFPPFSLFALPFLYFRYITLRYKFDDEGITMSWGILIHRKINLTYRRIQDIHLTSGILQRWLGLADIHIQTASGKAAAEMTIEGLLEFEEIRDFLYTRMRGYQKKAESASDRSAAFDAARADAGLSAATQGELIAILREITSEVRQTREVLASRQSASRSAPAEDGEDDHV